MKAGLAAGNFIYAKGSGFKGSRVLLIDQGWEAWKLGSQEARSEEGIEPSSKVLCAIIDFPETMER